MLEGRLYIDGKDAYSEYGVYGVEGGWNELIAYPPLKPVDSNDWQEEDGIEVDLSNPTLNSREVTVKFAFSGDYSRFISFIEFLSDGAYHVFDCAHIQRLYKLRLVSQPNMSILGEVALKFADDFPLWIYNYAPPMSSLATVDDYTLDGKPFTDYGGRVLEGTLAEILKSPDVKINLLINSLVVPGAQYDGKDVTYKSKDVNIYCLLRAETTTKLWRNYDALLYDLIRPNERVLTVKSIGEYFPVHYKSCTVMDFFPDAGKVWLRFRIVLTMIDGGGFGAFSRVLVTEEGRLLLTHDSKSIEAKKL